MNTSYVENRYSHEMNDSYLENLRSLLNDATTKMSFYDEAYDEATDPHHVSSFLAAKVQWELRVSHLREKIIDFRFKNKI